MAAASLVAARTGEALVEYCAPETGKCPAAFPVPFLAVATCVLIFTAVWADHPSKKNRACADAKCSPQGRKKRAFALRLC
jgi:hypothetical protein